jgi:hypothetical protein
MESVLTQARGVLEEAEQHQARGLTNVAQERAKGLAKVTQERAGGIAWVYARRAELEREVETMQSHKEAQEGRVELNIGGCRFQTSVQALRRVPHTCFDAYFSGRYAKNDIGNWLASVEKYTPLSNSWGAVASLSEVRYGHASVAVGSNHVRAGWRE